MQDVTASAAGALIGPHDFQTAYGLWALKSGLIDEEVEETPSMRRGRLLEPVALNMMREEMPSWSIEAAGHYYRDPTCRIGATPDAFAIDPDRDGFGVVQVKTVSPAVFKKKWRDRYGENWNDEYGETAVPGWIAIQTMVEAHLTGASWAVVAALVLDHGFEMYTVDVPINDGLIERLRNEVERFWMMVASGQAPDIDYARDAGTISRLKYNIDGPSIDLTEWNRGLQLAAEDKQLAEGISIAMNQRKEIKAEVLHKIGSASVATFNGQEFITARMVHRKASTTKASSFRDVRFKQTGEEP